MAIRLKPTRVKGSRYLLIPKDLAKLLDIDDDSMFNLTVEESGGVQQLVYQTARRSDESSES